MDDVNQGHVMISYQWGTKPMMIRVRDKLKEAGISIWMDIDNMSKWFILRSDCVIGCVLTKSIRLVCRDFERKK